MGELKIPASMIVREHMKKKKKKKKKLVTNEAFFLKKNSRLHLYILFNYVASVFSRQESAAFILYILDANSQHTDPSLQSGLALHYCEPPPRCMMPRHMRPASQLNLSLKGQI